MLREHITQDAVRHAYLITGAPGVGRRTLALWFAQAINCMHPPAAGEACGTCTACIRIQKMQHPDLSVLQAENEGGSLKVEMIREFQHTHALTPFEARYRVGLLLRFEEANPNAQNALLKTLEEPNPNVVLLLTASSADELLPTIVSRCEVLRLSPLPVAGLARALQERDGIDEPEATLLAHIAGGRPGLAYRYHQQNEFQEERRQALDTHRELIASSRAERFHYAEKVTKEKSSNRKEDIRTVLIHWLSFWRDVMLVCSGSSAPLTNIDYREEIQKASARMNLTAARDCTAAVERALGLVDKNINLRLALEILLLDLPQIAL